MTFWSAFVVLSLLGCLFLLGLSIIVLIILGIIYLVLYILDK